MPKDVEMFQYISRAKYDYCLDQIYTTQLRKKSFDHPEILYCMHALRMQKTNSPCFFYSQLATQYLRVWVSMFLLIVYTLTQSSIQIHINFTRPDWLQKIVRVDIRTLMCHSVLDQGTVSVSMLIFCGFSNKFEFLFVEQNWIPILPCML